MNIERLRDAAQPVGASVHVLAPTPMSGDVLVRLLESCGLSASWSEYDTEAPADTTLVVLAAGRAGADAAVERLAQRGVRVLAVETPSGPQPRLPGWGFVDPLGGVEELVSAVHLALHAGHRAGWSGGLPKQRALPAPQTNAMRRDDLLTAREREVFGLLADGIGNAQIAARLGISANTVRTHVSRILDKLGARNRAGAVAAAHRAGLLTAVRPSESRHG